MRKDDLIKQAMAEYHWMASVDKFRLRRLLEKLYDEAHASGRRDERKLQELADSWE